MVLCYMVNKNVICLLCRVAISLINVLDVVCFY